MQHARPDYQRIQDPAGLIPAAEPVFLLRAQDITAPEVVEHWATLNEARGGDAKAVAAARAHAVRMRAWPVRRLADLPPAKHPERILGIARDKLDAIAKWQGVCNERGHFERVLADCELRVRDEVEDDPGFKQLIPYNVFVHFEKLAGARQVKFVFCYTRGKGGGEARLHDFRSLGVGGHVEEADFGEAAFATSPWTAYYRARDRELLEEVAVRDSLPYYPLGLINDDSNPVGAVHLGVVHEVVLSSCDLASAEGHALTDGGFVQESLLPSLRDQFESWSRILIDHYKSKAV